MGRHSCCYKQKLRKGLWSPEEDEKLLMHITKYGHGCWSSVPKLAGTYPCMFIFWCHCNAEQLPILKTTNSSLLLCVFFSPHYTIYNLAGLQRCGKSCRLRWINYLRPDLKRGAFSQQEENLIIELHAVLGNRYFIFSFLCHQPPSTF